MRPQLYFLRKRGLPRSFYVLLLALFLLFAASVRQPLRAQTLSADDRENGQQMLRSIRDDLKKHYYDPAVHGFDLDGRVKQAAERVKKAQSNGEIMGIIAQVLIEVNDSHTIFIPPRRAARVEYGWEIKAVGDDCFVSAVRPGSDADGKGLKVGDKVVSVDGRPLTRDKIWLAKYLYYSLRPQPGMRLVVQSPDGQQRQVDVLAKVTEVKKILNFSGDDNGEDVFNEIRESQSEDHLRRHRFSELGDDAFVWKMPQFDLSEEEIGNTVGKFRKRKALVLDLRGNGGGYVKTLQWLAAYFFDHDVKIADLRGRRETKPIVAKGRPDAFKGRLIVLVDAESASAAEIFARLVQLENRGTVIGDRSSGMVMESRFYDHQIGVDKVIYYGATVTEADVIMSDGKSLEGAGVTPDETVLPSAADMAAGRDPALARAAALTGFKLEPEKAGKFFPVEWRK
jgi:C-terminal processing protease CtpA/Prc